MKRAAIAGLAVVWSTAAAQQRPEIHLAPASNIEFGADFTALLGMRELPDGRLLLSQRGEPGLAVADFRDGSLRPIGRKGKGPGEYELAYAIIALGGDSTLVCDFAYRWLILVGARVVQTVSPGDSAVRAITYACPLGADGTGRMLTRDFRPRRNSAENDSVDLAIVDRPTGRKTHVGSLRLHPPRTGAPQSVEVGGGVGFRVVPLDVAEEGLLFRDGWMGVARIQPYRVDWRTPEGEWIRGRPLPFHAIPFTERERRAYARGRRGVASAPVWPRDIPPFDKGPGALLPTPEGLLAVRRVPSADAPETRVDLVDRTGTLRRVIVLGVRERILGFGARSVYVVRVDADDLEYVRRHPWPRDVGLSPTGNLDRRSGGAR